MKKDINWSRVALVIIGIIWIIMALTPDYTYLFSI